MQRCGMRNGNSSNREERGQARSRRHLPLSLLLHSHNTPNVVATRLSASDLAPVHLPNLLQGKREAHPHFTHPFALTDPPEIPMPPKMS